MAEVGRQQRNPVSRFPAISISIENGIDRKSMPQVVQPRPARTRACLEAGAVSNLAEGRLDIDVEQPGANRGNQ